MHIPYPERISYAWATTFAVALFIVQIFEQTHLIFALCAFAFILTSTAAFNIAGGLYRPAGAYIFFNATLTAILGLVVKAALGEPAQGNLANADLTMEVYLCGMLAMLFGAYVESRLRPSKSFIEARLPMPSLRSVYIGSTAIALFLKVIYAIAALGVINSPVIQTIYNGDHFLPFALILGVMYTIRTSHGQRSITPWLAFLFLLSTGEGLLSFSKQALFAPAFCWILAVAICRYKLKIVNIISLVIVVYVAYTYATPYSQYGRVFSQGGGLANVRLAEHLLTHIDEVVKTNAEITAGEYGKLAYYNHSMGLLDRLEMLSPDDALIGVTEEYGPMGYFPLVGAMGNVIPRILWPDKPFLYFGNLYAHQVGAITDDDVSTSVSFGLSADMYREGGLTGVLVILPACTALVFFLVSWFLGDVRAHPAAIIAVLVVAHTAPEGAIGGLFGVLATTQYMVILAFACKYVLPVVSSIFDREKALTPTAERTFGMA